MVEEREVGGVVLVLVVREEEGVGGWEKERSGMSGMIRVSFGRRVLGIMRLSFWRRVLVVVCAIVGNLDGAMWNVRIGMSGLLGFGMMSRKSRGSLGMLIQGDDRSTIVQNNAGCFEEQGECSGGKGLVFPKV